MDRDRGLLVRISFLEQEADHVHSFNRPLLKYLNVKPPAVRQREWRNLKLGLAR